MARNRLTTARDANESRIRKKDPRICESLSEIGSNYRVGAFVPVGLFCRREPRPDESCSIRSALRIVASPDVLQEERRPEAWSEVRPHRIAISRRRRLAGQNELSLGGPIRSVEERRENRLARRVSLRRDMQ